MITRCPYIIALCTTLFSDRSLAEEGRWWSRCGCAHLHGRPGEIIMGLDSKRPPGAQQMVQLCGPGRCGF